MSSLFYRSYAVTKFSFSHIFPIFFDLGILFYLYYCFFGFLFQLASKARSVIRTLDPQNDITFLRVRSKKHEIMVAPDKDYLLFVIQNPNSSEEDSA